MGEKEKKRQKIYRTIMLVTVVALVTYIITTVLMYNDSIKYIVSTKNAPNASFNKKVDTLLATITELIDEKYIGEVNEEELIDGAISGLVDSLGDKYTMYYSKKELEEFTAQTLGNFVGIGVYMKANFEEDVIEIVEPIEGSPAEEVGLKPGDKILKAEGVEYKAKELEKLSNNIKGEEGTEVTLTIKREEETFDVKVTRRTVHVKYVEGQMLDDNIGYIGIATFDEDCAKDFEAEYDKIVEQGAKSLIIDLRGNGGGIVDEALAIADLMCEKDDITLIKVDKNGKESITKSKTERKIKMPVVVLTNIASASSSEILVAALKENGRAEIVGDKTFGKGVIQDLIYLSNGGALRVTSSEYYTPKKNKINEVGIEPNYKVLYDSTTPEKDEQLEKAKELLGTVQKSSQ